MKTDPWMPLWIGDYLRDTMHLTTIQHGGYLMVLMALWTSPSGKLPFDEKTLCRITRMTPQEWEENHLVITQFLTVKDGMFYQQRLLHERLKSEEIRKKRAESGRLGGRPRKAFGLESEKNQTVKQNESKTKVSHNHNHSTKEPPLSPKAKKRAVDQVLIPEVLNKPEFLTAWSDWIQARKDNGKRVSYMAGVHQIKMLSELGVEKAILSIRQSITNDWRGLFPPKEDKPRTAPASPNQMLIDAIG